MDIVELYHRGITQHHIDNLMNAKNIEEDFLDIVKEYKRTLTS
ncbi:Uncharacterised protein [uncultured archaeon]|nr:Uncharacterised protein [uncultured archaeon]